jgi:hypothetical protein
MTWVNMLAWWQWALLGLIPPTIVLLYFLKLKREPLEVPSTYLWSKSIEDLHVNSIWQRLRNNLLLLLQLVAVALLMLSLIRLGWQGSQLTGERFVFLIDNSASMAADDVAPSRLAEAKRRVGELIDQMKSGDQAMIISFCDTARVEQLFTDNRRELRGRLDAIGQTSRGTALGEALRLASGLAASPSRPASDAAKDERPAEIAPATLYIFSDGKFPDVGSVALGQLTPVYVPIGTSDAANLAVTAFSTRRPEGKPDKLQAFGRLENYGSQEVAAEVELYRDGSLVDASRVTVKPGGSAGVAFELSEMHDGSLELMARPGGSLAIDDRAWAAVAPPQRARVLVVTPGDAALERGLESAGDVAEVKIERPAFLKQAEYAQQMAASQYDLVIYELCRPAEMPAANTLFIGNVPPGSDWTAGARVAAPQVIDVNSSHPLMQYVDLGNVLFATGMPVKPPAGGTSLIDSNRGTLFAVAPREGWEDAALGAEIVTVDEKGELTRNTDWPLRLSFIVMLRNVIEYLGGQRLAGQATAIEPGQLVTLRLSQPSEAVHVKKPSGRTVTLRPTRQNTFNFNESDELGIYEVQEPTAMPRRFAVNLCNSAESDIRSRPENSIKIGYVEVAGRTQWEGARRETWRPLLLATLVVLLLEWYIYNRRVFI